MGWSDSKSLVVCLERLVIFHLHPVFANVASDLCRSKKLLGTTNLTDELVGLHGLKGLLGVRRRWDYRLAPGRTKSDGSEPLDFLALIFDTYLDEDTSPKISLIRDLDSEPAGTTTPPMFGEEGLPVRVADPWDGVEKSADVCHLKRATHPGAILNGDAHMGVPMVLYGRWPGGLARTAPVG